MDIFFHFLVIHDYTGVNTKFTCTTCWRLHKLIFILQAHPNAFSCQIFFLYFFIRISLGLVSDGPSQVTIRQHQFRKWLVVQRATSYCLDLLSPHSQTHACVKRLHRINADAFMFQFTHVMWCFITNRAMYQKLPCIGLPCILKHNSKLSITPQYETHYCSKDPCHYIVICCISETTNVNTFIRFNQSRLLHRANHLTTNDISAFLIQYQKCIYGHEFSVSGHPV